VGLNIFAIIIYANGKTRLRLGADFRITTAPATAPKQSIAPVVKDLRFHAL
jgi:hypothetical protein